jgi:hypothetical protein
MAEPTGILRRIARALGGEDIVDALVRLPARDLQSLLLHVFARRTENLGPLDLLAQFERTPAFAPSYAEPRLSNSFLQAAFAAASAFEAIELSPVCPLGTMRVLAGIHQNNVLSASRGGEVLADPTPVLALECARRRQHPPERSRSIRLCATQRVMRMQPVTPLDTGLYGLSFRTHQGRWEKMPWPGPLMEIVDVLVTTLSRRTLLLRPSRRPLESPCSMAARTPWRCSRRVRASLMKGCKREREAQASQASRYGPASLAEVWYRSRSASLRR